MVGRDVSGRGVQTTLLKLMEETDVPLRSANDLQAQLQAAFEFQRRGGKAKRETISTRHILFVVSGAFERLKQQVSRRLTQGQIGFNAEPRQVMDNELFQFVTTQDFIEYGFEPEFIGRLPVRVVCEELSADDLYKIMKFSEGSILRQYERAFRAYGIEISFEDEALRLIADSGGERENRRARSAHGLGKTVSRLQILPGRLGPEPVAGLGGTGARTEAGPRSPDGGRATSRKKPPWTKRASLRRPIQEAARSGNCLRRIRPRAPGRTGPSRAHDDAGTLRASVQGLPVWTQPGPEKYRPKNFILGREAVDAPDKFLSDLVVHSHYPLAPAAKELRAIQ